MDEKLSASNMEYEEIDLREMFGTLRKRWRLVFGVTAFAAFAAWGVSSAIPKTYNIKTILEIGNAPNQSELVPIEEAGQVAKKIESDFYGDSIRKKLNISEKEYPKIKVDNFSDNLISISVDSSDTHRAESILRELDSIVINDYASRGAQKKSVVAANIDIQKKDIERLNNKIQSLDKEKKIIEEEVLSLNNALIYKNDVPLALALTSDQNLLISKQQDIESLYLQINDNSQQINIMSGLLDQMRPTAVVEEPAVSQSAVWPITFLNVILGALLGFVVGTFLAFGIEWWKKNA